MRNSKTKAMVIASIMAAVAFVLQYFSFSVPFLSPFASLDFSPLPEIIGGFLLGPVWAVVIIIIKLSLILAIKGTSSMFTGEIQNFLLSVAYVLPAVLYYRNHRTKKGAVMALILGSVICVVVSIFTNLYIIFPFYIKLYGMTWESIIEACNAVNPFVTNMPTFVACSVVPFNLVSKAMSSIVTALVYKRISLVVKRFMQN